MQKALSSLLQICLYALGFSFTNSQISLAQVTSDNTVNTQVTQNGNVAEIKGGETRGSNLFHSFQDFSVPTGNEASFNNANNIENIFSRVTGGNISNIDGAIRNNGSANLFLINPAGIILGKNARLDIGGSFLGSTASSILFENGEFNAADLENPPLLTVNAPIGLGFRDEPGDIINRSTVTNSVEETVGLEVLPGNNITLLGGNINFDAGNVTAKGGRIELGGLSQAGTIGINENGNLNLPDNIAKADITLSNAADVDVRGSGGSINLNARNLTLASGRSSIRAGIAADSSSGEAQAGNITINVDENIAIDNSSISNSVDVDGVGNAGSINITTTNLTLNNGAKVDASTSGDGDTGFVNVTATDTIAIDAQDFTDFVTGITSTVKEGGIGNSKGININSGNLTVSNGGRIAANTSGIGNAGQVDITATDSIVFDGRNFDSSIASGVASRVDGIGNGNSGGININTANLTLSDGGSVDASTLGNGDSGFVNITATDTIGIDARDSAGTVTGITSIVKVDATGNSKGINIDTANLTASNGGRIAANTSGIGNAGRVNITATDSIVFNGRNSQTNIRSGAASLVDEVGEGESGGLNITTSNLALSNEGIVEATTKGAGNAGAIDIDVNNLTLTNGGRIAANTSGDGNAGRVNITATDSIIFDGKNSQGDIFSGVASRVDGIGNGDSGGIKITSNNLILSNEGIVEATTLSEGNAGDVEIATNNLTLTNGGRIDANTVSEGNAGKLTINATEAIAINGATEQFRSNISANALVSNGNSGNVNLYTDRLTIENGGAIEASNVDSLGILKSGTGRSGNINIEANSIALNNGGRIEAITQSVAGDNANINLTVADTITLQNNSFISAKAIGEANGGNLKIDTDFIIAFPNGNNDIVANAQQGQGGNIDITAKSLFGIEQRSLYRSTNDIDASSDDINLNGNVLINSLNNNIVRESRQLPKTLVIPEKTIVQACQANREAEAKNGLNIEGKGGIPAEPVLPLDSRNIVINGENTNSISATLEPVETSQGKIQPARGIKTTKSGDVILTAYRTSNSGDRLAEIKRNCG